MSIYIPNAYNQENKILNSFSLSEHHDKSPDNITIFIIIDGLSDDFFRRNIYEAPNLNNIIHNGGYYAKNTTCIPSCTGIAHTYLMTGVCADKHSISGINFFNLENLIHYNCLSTKVETLLNESLSKEILTIFEQNKNVKSASIWNPVTRGADINISYHSTWYRHAAKMAMEQIRNGARILTIWYPLLDPIGHYLGNEHAFRKFWFHRIDYQIGLLCQELSKNKLLNKSMIYITSDHGQTKTSKQLDLFKFLKNLGFTVKGATWETVNVNSLDDFDIFLCRNGYRFAHIYFGNNICEEQKEIIKELLLQEEGIRNTFTKKNENILVESRHGCALIQSDNSAEAKYSYQVLSGADPLNYDDSFDLIDANYYSEKEWKKETILSESPNVVPQIHQLMMAKTSGEITVVASEDYQFTSLPHKAGHGGFTKEEMIVPTIALFPTYEEDERVRKLAKK